MVKMKDVEVEGEKPVFEVLNYIETTGRRDEILAESGRQNQNLAYEYSPFNLLKCWMFLIFFALLYAVIATVSLESIDKDKR
jgi:hypothetical protein